MQNNSASASSRDDEIDLLKLFLLLWRGRAIIILTVLGALAVAAFYLMMAPKTYEIKVKFVPLLQSLTEDELISYIDRTPTLTQVMATRQVNRVANDFSVEWKAGILTFRDDSIVDVQAVADEMSAKIIGESHESLENSLALTDQIITQDPVFLNSNSEGKFATLLKTRSVATELRMSGAIGKFVFGDVVKVKPKTSLIMALSVVFGGMVGCGVVLIWNALKTYRTKAELEV
jgi:hypothetical protein